MIFKEFLEGKCIEETHCIKDNFEEHWEAWYGGLLKSSYEFDDKQLMAYAEEWKKQELKKWVELADNAIQQLQKIRSLIE